MKAEIKIHTVDGKMYHHTVDINKATFQHVMNTERPILITPDGHLAENCNDRVCRAPTGEPTKAYFRSKRQWQASIVFIVFFLAVGAILAAFLVLAIQYSK